MRKPIPLLVLLALAVAALAAAPASANKVLDDCNSSVTGLLTGRYTRRQLTGALNELDGDTSDYSNCYDAIRVALSDLRRSGGGNSGDNGNGNDGSDTGGGDLGGGGFDDGLGDPGAFDDGGGAAGGGNGRGGGSGEATSTSPQVPATSQPGSSAPVQLADTSVTPSIPAAIASDANALPTPLIALLALLGVGAIAVAGTTIWRRALARRRD